MNERLLREEIRDVPEYVPGKSIEEVKKEYGLKNVIKLASNENPYGPSEKVFEEIRRGDWKLNRYPPVEVPELKVRVGEYTGCNPDQIVFGAGVDGVLETLFKLFCRKGDEILIPIPTFPYYEILTRVYGGKPVFVRRDEKYDVTAEMIESRISRKTKMIILCSPNNPTGNSIPNEELSEVLESTSAIVIVDEAYAEFADWNALSLAGKFDNLILTRTFSKAFGLAGLRIGYGILPDWIVPHYMRVNPPFSLGTLSISCALKALEDLDHVSRTVEKIKEDREWLLRKVPFRAFPSQANFFMMDTTPYTADELSEKLLRKGIIIRNLSGFRGTDGHMVRISVGREEENRKLIEAMEEIA